MTGRELLEMAARAAGYNGFPGHADQMIDSGWNPLEDDADAFRLMVSVGLDVEWCSSGRVSAYRHANANGHCFTAMESYREDRAAATRRAIVRAAAEMAE